AEFLAGSVEYSQLRSIPMAYEYWRRCSSKGHAGCMNSMASASLTGAGGQAVDIGQALELHEKVFNTGTKYTCAGALSAEAIAEIIHFTGVRRPGDDGLAWLEKARQLRDLVIANHGGKDICFEHSFQIDEFLF